MPETATRNSTFSGLSRIVTSELAEPSTRFLGMSRGGFGGIVINLHFNVCSESVDIDALDLVSTLFGRVSEFLSPFISINRRFAAEIRQKSVILPFNRCWKCRLAWFTDIVGQGWKRPQYGL
jgi:hypothetical protein